MSDIGKLHHLGITVRDLELSLRWYQDVLGATIESVDHLSGQALSAAVAVPEARLRYAFLRLGGSRLELLCYDNDRDESFSRSNADVGSAHVCLEVSDLQATYADLAAKGVDFLSAPFHMADGPLAGCSFVYLKDPDGISVELTQRAGGVV